MSKNTLLKDFFKYGSLNILGMLGLSCYILADTFFVAKGLGTNGIAALNIAIPIYSIIHATGIMLAMGCATKYSVYKAQKNHKKANEVFTVTLYLFAVFCLIFLLAGLFFSENIASLLGANSSVHQMTTTYIKVLFLFSPAFLMNDILVCCVRNDSSPSLSMCAMLAGSFSNILLDYILIFVFDLGIFGAVFATGLAPVISIAVMLPYFIKKKNGFHFIKTKASISHVKNIFIYGLPSMITELSGGIVIIVFNKIILSLAGNTQVAAYGIIANISLVIAAVYTGLSQGVQPIVSREYAKNNLKNCTKLLKYAVICDAIISAAVYVFLFIFAQNISDIFNSENNPLLTEIASKGIRIYFTACIFWGFNIIMSIYFTSTLRAKFAHIISFLRGFAIIIPCAFILSHFFKITGVWLALPVTEILVCITAMILMLISSKNNK